MESWGNYLHHAMWLSTLLLWKSKEAVITGYEEAYHAWGVRFPSPRMVQSFRSCQRCSQEVEQKVNLDAIDEMCSEKKKVLCFTLERISRSMLTVTNKIYIRVTAFLFQKCVFVEINLEPEIEKILNLLFNLCLSAVANNSNDCRCTEIVQVLNCNSVKPLWESIVFYWKIIHQN